MKKYIISYIFQPFLFLVYSTICVPSLFPQTTLEGKIQEVILYRNQAQIVRYVELDLKEGSHEIIISKLPAQIIHSSVFAEAIGADVRAARIRSQELIDDPSDEVRKLDEEIEKVNHETEIGNKLIQVNQKKLAYLEKQENFSAVTEKMELSKGVLNPQTMKEITLFHFEQRKELALEENKIRENLNDLNKKRNLLLRKRKQLTSSSPRNLDASVFLDKTGQGKVTIKLYYLVNNASWAPTYNFYAKDSENQIKVEFNARIQQLSGENWDSVQLTLSNATPALSAISPTLSPFRLSLSQNTGSGASYPGDVKNLSQNISRQMEQAQKKQMAAQNWGETEEGGWEMNRAANDYQSLELIAKDEDLSFLKRESGRDASSPSVSFPLKGKISLESKRDQQLVKVEKMNLPARFYNVATPILTSYVFKEAEIENNSKETFLEGQVNAYFDDRFVGKGEISNVAVGQNFLMGFGIDTQIRTKRELYDKKEKILGGNKEITFNVRIVIENFYKKEMEVRVLDRIPAEDEKENVRITTDMKSNPLSKDELYERYERSKGLLRWDIDLKADGSGTKSKIIDYTYKLEFDKNLTIGVPSSQKTDQMKNEFMEIQKMKYRK